MVEPQIGLSSQTQQVERQVEKTKKTVGGWINRGKKIFGGGEVDINQVRENLFIFNPKYHVPDVNPDGSERTQEQMKTAVLEMLDQWKIENKITGDKGKSLDTDKDRAKALKDNATVKAQRPSKDNFKLEDPANLKKIREALLSIGEVSDVDERGNSKSQHDKDAETLKAYYAKKRDMGLADKKDYEAITSFYIAVADEKKSQDIEKEKARIEAEKAKKAAEEKAKKEAEEKARKEKEAADKKKAEEDAKKKHTPPPAKKPASKRRPTAELHGPDITLPPGVTLAPEEGASSHLGLNEVAVNLQNSGTAPDGKAENGQKKPDETPGQKDETQRTV